MSKSIVIVGLARTPLGAMQGELSSEVVSSLGASAIKGAIADAGISANSVDELIMGCVLTAGVGQALARQAIMKAGIPETQPGYIVGKVCGSGMKTVALARQALLLKEKDIVIAGGMESMSQSPYLLSKARGGYRLGHGEVNDHMFTDGLEDASTGQLMGVFAENTAQKYGFSRKAQDDFALESLARANKAIKLGYFDREIAPYTIKVRAGDVTINVDESPGNAKPDKIPQLRPAFKKDGTVTAANASSIADGAAALVLMREDDAIAKGLKPLAKIVAVAEHGCAPEWFTTAPIGAIKTCLNTAKWDINDVDLFEINEAFAVVTMAAMHELSIPYEKVNIHGGACALGHPLGATGARILVTLIAALKQHNKHRGIASLCIGGGEGMAVAVEAL